MLRDGCGACRRQCGRGSASEGHHGACGSEGRRGGVVAARVAAAMDGAVPSAVSKAVAAPASVVRRSARLWPSRHLRQAWRQPPS